MENVIKEILKWPVIVQGALGSGLFWLLLLLGQRLLSVFINIASSYSDKIKIEHLKFLKNKYIGALAHFRNDNLLATAMLAGLHYQSTRFLCKGLIWLCFGFIFQNLLGVLGVVGFIGATYYFFFALNRVQRIETNIDIDKKIKEIDKSIAEISEAKIANKSIKRDV